MQITIDNYTDHCLKTWGGPNQRERDELGIIGELGEVAEVLKKHLRGDFDEVERDKRLLKELGDLLYYVAIDMHLHGLDISHLSTYHHSVPSCSIIDLNNSISVYLDSRFASINDEEVLDSFEMFISTYGFTIEQVMTENIKKLSCRAERGVINGSGDDR